MVDLKQKLKDLPAQSGVYIMYNSDNEVIYVGKARILKNRVRQYFQGSSNKTEKVLAMVERIADFSYFITNNEIDALILENNLIKKYKPPYNILLKDDKQYPFVRINVKEDFPRLEVVRRLKEDGAKYFGPYMAGVGAKDILDIIGSAFRLRSCKLNFEKIPSSHRPCLNFHIDRCLAPCSGTVSKEEYHRVVNDVVSFLSGNDKSVQKILEEKMYAASEATDYELALFYRDKLEKLSRLVRQQITAIPKDLNLDIFGVADNGKRSAAAILYVRGGKLLGGDKFLLDDAALSSEDSLSTILMQHYDSDVIQADEITLAAPISGSEELAEFLSKKKGRKVVISVPHQGIRKKLCEMAQRNALDFLEKSQSQADRMQAMTVGAVTELGRYLGLENPPQRMECYDISNISGTDKVSSMVVFTGGAKNGAHYRRFKIKTVVGSDDFASMHETLLRRLNRYKEAKDASFSVLPDLIVIDGGLGQLSSALKAMEEAQVFTNIVSLAKREEEVFKPGSSTPIIIPKSSEALKLLQRIRDEAHRFAITYHRKLRLNRQTKSELVSIEGIGEKRAAALFRSFKTLERIKNATEKELAQAEGMNQKAANAVYRHFHNT